MECFQVQMLKEKVNARTLWKLWTLTKASVETDSKFLVKQTTER